MWGRCRRSFFKMGRRGAAPLFWSWVLPFPLCVGPAAPASPLAGEVARLRDGRGAIFSAFPPGGISPHLRAKSRRCAAVALRNAPAGAARAASDFLPGQKVTKEPPGGVRNRQIRQGLSASMPPPPGTPMLRGRPLIGSRSRSGARGLCACLPLPPGPLGPCLGYLRNRLPLHFCALRVLPLPGRLFSLGCAAFPAKPRIILEP